MIIQVIVPANLHVHPSHSEAYQSDAAVIGPNQEMCFALQPQHTFRNTPDQSPTGGFQSEGKNQWFFNELTFSTGPKSLRTAAKPTHFRLRNIRGGPNLASGANFTLLLSLGGKQSLPETGAH